MYKKLLFLLVWAVFVSGKQKETSFSSWVISFSEGCRQLHIPETDYDYRNYFSSIPDSTDLLKQLRFFTVQQQRAQRTDTSRFSLHEKIQLDHIRYEIELNLQRIHLEHAWIKNGRTIPANGLYALKTQGDWYAYFIKRFTSLSLSPEEIMQLGKHEVTRVKKEIENIRKRAGWKDSLGFYQFLASDTFTITDPQKLQQVFHSTDSTIRKHLRNWVGAIPVAEIHPIEWPQANENTPPGIYLDRNNNAYGKDVFMYNFYETTYNSRAIEWLYMHEAIPGHHLQSCFNRINKPDSLQETFWYPGNFEGWACYVEYEGKNMGVYSNLYSYLGKWEWDLVRSARLVIETGIHFYGWSRQQALQYWNENLPGQSRIAEREITRVTNWPGQALSYKTGAACILQLKQKITSLTKSKFNAVRFHRGYLNMGKRPLEVIKKHMYAYYLQYK